MAQSDPLWDVRGQEEANRKARKSRKDGLERAINLGKRALQLQSQPGYLDFTKAVTDVRNHVLDQILAHVGTDSELRVKQGQAQAYDNVLRILDRSQQAIETLEAQLAAMHNQEQNLPPRER